MTGDQHRRRQAPPGARSANHIDAASVESSKENTYTGRPRRTNQGQGGKAIQLENLEKKICDTKRSRKDVVQVPETVPDNPMAPTAPKRGRRPKKNNNLSLANKGDLQQTSIPPPQFLVPPGTEPSLQPPRNPVQQTTVAGSRFGFQQNQTRTGSSVLVEEQPPLPPQKSRNAEMCIDPVLLNMSKPLEASRHPTSSRQSTNLVRVSNGHRADQNKLSKPLEAPQRPASSRPSTNPTQPIRRGERSVTTPWPRPVDHGGTDGSDEGSDTESSSNPESNSGDEPDGSSLADEAANGHATHYNNHELHDNHDNHDLYDNHDNHDNHESHDYYEPHIECSDDDLPINVTNDNHELHDQYERTSGVNNDEQEYSQDNHHPTFIDEASPDEDERIALKALQQPQAKAGQKRKRRAKDVVSQPQEPQLSDSYDILETHHNRNRQVRPPNPKHLEECAVRQVHQAQEAVGPPDEAGVPDPYYSCSSGSEEEPTQKRAKRHSKKPYRSSNLDPTQLQFYPSQWRDILEAAKKKHQLAIVLEMLFPDRKKNFNLAVDCLEEAIADHEANGGLVEDGFYPKYAKDMATLVYEDGATFRGTMKRRGRTVTQNKYDLFPDPSDMPHGQQEYAESVQTRVQELLRHGAYLQNGTDSLGRTNNFEHPALIELCIDFFYSSENSLGHLFPEVFGDRLPPEAIAMGGTLTYDKILLLIEQVQRDLYHGHKFKMMLKRCAEAGRLRGGIANAGLDNVDLEVVLD